MVDEAAVVARAGPEVGRRVRRSRPRSKMSYTTARRAHRAEGGKVPDLKFIHAADLHLDSPLLGLAGKSADFAARVEAAFLP